METSNWQRKSAFTVYLTGECNENDRVDERTFLLFTAVVAIDMIIGAYLLNERLTFFSLEAFK